MKTWAVFKREYLQAVRRASFLVMTLLAPFLMAALLVIPVVLTTSGVGEKRVLVIDGTGRLGADLAALAAPDEADELAGNTGLSATLHVETIEAPGDVDAALAASLPRLRVDRAPPEARLDGIVVVPPSAIDDPDARAAYYARAATDWLVQRRLERAVNRGVMRERWRARGVDPAVVGRVEKRVALDTVRVSREGHAKAGGDVDYVIGFAFVALLFIPILLYGQTIMLGIVQEKSDRVVEVLLSSLSARELLTGKVLGLAAVGLTQVAVWMAMATAASAVVGVQSGLDLSRFVRAGVFGWFVVFFVLGYLIQVCVYAMGGAIANSEREARHVIMPVSLAMMVPWFMVTPILTNPESGLSITLSLIPVFTPITMFMRILVSDPPAWQVAASVAATTATIALLFRVTARVFRVGILSYGKRPTAAELWRWARQ